MCFSILFGKPQPETPPTFENLRDMVRRMGAGLSDVEQCRLWYDIEQMAFNELGEIWVETWEVRPEIIQRTITEQYPNLTDLKLPDSQYWVTDLVGGRKILSRDWTNFVPYIINRSDCDKFAIRLYEHLCRYYKITTWFPVWGEAPGGYHAFNCAVFRETSGYIARLVEPQSDEIFLDRTAAGLYVPDTAVETLGILKMKEATNG